ncbi:hypothetical protein FHK94_08270 [Cylindrospermopsis raciborskii CS-506_D]|nr:hypothetical protein [Cylindrospermopsis raciborskii]MBA4449685.1 hypothetical protein [Cylindrospermopsis raciborskii CS-506_D]MBA4456305.1 hypothetical protein [Cylindrospermopsis raciborskii CS-506_B]
MEWKEGGILGDYDPRIAITNISASELAKKREELFDRHPGLRAAYIQEYEEISGTKNFLNAEQNYPLLKGSQTNLFKCFLPQGWRYTRAGGVSAFLHPEGVYDDPKGGRLRRAIYQRLRYHFQFQNQYILFPIKDGVKYSLNVYGSEKLPEFTTIANLFTSKTVDECLEHDGKGEVKGIKDESNKWNVQGHKERIITVNRERLNLFAQLYDDEGTPGEEARLPTLHSQQLMGVMEKFAAQERRLRDLQGEYFATVMWDETNSQKDQTIKRNTQFAQGAEQLILSGPHFFVGNPLNKTPRKVCKTKSDYDVIDLTQIPPDYLPRTNYLPDCAPRDYLDRTPRVPWGEQKPVTDFYRVINRKMLSQSAERTLIPVIIPKQVGHVNSCISVTFENTKHLISVTGLLSSLPYDFFIKTTGKSNFYNESFSQFPYPNVMSSLHIRTLVLNCLTKYYGDLWEENWHNEYTQESWSKPQDPRLNNNFFGQLTPFWQRNNALRTDYERRQALIEIDVLAAMSLGMTLDELNTIYRVQFPVMQQYEKDTYYDMNGRIVFTINKGLVGVGLPRKGNPKTKSRGWEEIKDMTTGPVEVPIVNQTLSNNPANQSIIYQAPFVKCDRIEDYRKAWDYFRCLD